jgi:hypothetical protein
MNNKQRFVWILIIAVAILTSAAIIFPSALAFSGKHNYLNEAETSSENIDNPEAVVQAFYIWYLNYFGDRAAGTFQSPLADQAYQDSHFLTPSFIEHIDEILAGFDEYGGYDPFLCAQDIPQGVITDGIFYHNGLASVVVQSDFPNHFLTVDLQKSGDGWQINNITCANNPAGTVQAFYTWYLAYIGDRDFDGMRNPLSEGAYRNCGSLSEGFIQELDDLTAEGLPADPILLAQSIPQDFSVDPGTEAGTAIVHLQFGTETVQHVKVSLIQEMGGWKIMAIEQAQ